jgi:hypothetical protein
MQIFALHLHESSLRLHQGSPMVCGSCREVAFLPPLSRRDEDLLLELAK